MVLFMVNDLLLASSSSIRKQLFEKANVSVKCVKPNVDEESVKASLLMEKYKARDIADALAELKATKVSSMNPANLVIGCDQILELEGSILKKPASKEKAIDQILTMSEKNMWHIQALLYVKMVNLYGGLLVKQNYIPTIIKRIMLQNM